MDQAKRSKCPYCGTLNDVSMPLNHEEEIRPGDVSVCFSCGEPSFFTTGEVNRSITEVERAEIMQIPEMFIILQIIKNRDKENEI